MPVHIAAAELLVTVVNGRALRGLVRPSGKEAEGDGRPGRSRGRRPDARGSPRLAGVATRIEGTWHRRPWQGPIVTVVYRFLASSIESKPSAIARLRSLSVTSSQTQTKHLSLPEAPL